MPVGVIQVSFEAAAIVSTHLYQKMLRYRTVPRRGLYGFAKSPECTTRRVHRKTTGVSSYITVGKRKREENHSCSNPNLVDNSLASLLRGYMP